MPLWQIYHPSDTYTDQASKTSFASDITKMYKELGLPAFYVVTNFIPLPKGDILVGGKAIDKPFIRIVITHIAITMPNEDETYKRSTSRIDQILKINVADLGYDWEYHIDETERRLWKINGMVPPSWGSEEERVWVKENRAVFYEGAY
ncbi:hypothetical protein PENANT_c019G04846 [Penicillium antarcticum]|uniref:Tautomerase cis-CaaD-like domain-containing protein n=1 Tax=Penicillium antarcticum TaxID=416450 RepID=A0A1V6Q1P9_9EURO|nr:uncharacterized protein N7508_001166 [Penicillium antarcticum]KAJ5316658.1 hypothetical protein N7508_001166 [Penicillium antarcticum]OQD82977.1 hypothetical protein PENANT_c019G04846 [Penicillium antarcticum]